MVTHDQFFNDHFGKNRNDTSVLFTRHDVHPPGETRGVALVIHGLNLCPDKMEALIKLLNSNRIDVISLSLRGHGSNFKHHPGIIEKNARLRAFKKVSYNLWLKETCKAYHVAQKLSVNKRVPLFFVGFSLGGLLGTDLFVRNAGVRFDRMVLLAPALDIRFIHYAAKIFYPFPGFVIPSLSPKQYRANKGTTIAAYHSLFDAVKHFKENINSRLNIPTIVFIDRQDEMVSHKGLQNIIKTSHFDRWTIRYIQKVTSETTLKPHHLIIDEPSVGKTTWEKMKHEIIAHLLNGQ